MNPLIPNFNFLNIPDQQTNRLQPPGAPRKTFNQARELLGRFNQKDDIAALREVLHHAEFDINAQNGYKTTALQMLLQKIQTSGITAEKMAFLHELLDKGPNPNLHPQYACPLGYLLHIQFNDPRDRQELFDRLLALGARIDGTMLINDENESIIRQLLTQQQHHDLLPILFQHVHRFEDELKALVINESIMHYNDDPSVFDQLTPLIEYAHSFKDKEGFAPIEHAICIYDSEDPQSMRPFNVLISKGAVSTAKAKELAGDCADIVNKLNLADQWRTAFVALRYFTLNPN